MMAFGATLRTSSGRISGVGLAKAKTIGAGAIFARGFFAGPIRYDAPVTCGNPGLTAEHLDGRPAAPLVLLRPLDASADSFRESLMGTVGAVALDAAGDLAAATSTGGMTAKRWGRVGDSPVIGAGTYAANDCCAVSATGHGEYFIRATVAHEIASLIRYAGKSVREAADIVVHGQLQQMGGEGGVIVVGRDGTLALPFNSRGMLRGSIDAQGRMTTGIL